MMVSILERKEVIDALEQTGAIYIILVLFEKGELQTRELLEEIPVGRTAAYSAIRKLLKLKIIQDRKEGYPVTRIFSLTEKGKEFAEKIKSAIAIIEK